MPRRVHLDATVAATIDQLEEYSGLHAPRHALRAPVVVGAATDGTTVVRLPEAIHPWLFHNVAYWLLDTPGAGHLLAVSGRAPTHAAYWLARDPELVDCLCGVDDAATAWTVHVPDNAVVQGDPIPLPDRGVPTDDATVLQTIEVLVEDPGHDLNPENEATVPTRRRLRDRFDHTAFI